MSKNRDRRILRRDRFFLRLEQRHPFLLPFARLLWFEPWFRLICLGLCAALIGGTLFVVKIWRTTPSGFLPEIRVSGIDLLRAHALQRSARKEAARGHFDEAIQTWLMAVANNAGDAELVRGTLHDLAEGTDTLKYSDISQRFGTWLLRLRGTNVTDLELITGVYEKQRLPEATIATLKHCGRKLTPKLEATYLKALFDTGDMAGFDALWRSVEKKPEILGDPILKLYRAAFLAGWTEGANSLEAADLLREAKHHPETAEVAHRLQLRVSLQLLDGPSYRSSLDYLQQNFRATLKDHLGYWNLLIAIGRKQEAVKLIQASGLKPGSGEEAVQLSKIYFEAGLNNEAGAMLKTYAAVFPTSESLWASYANLLIEQKRWDELRGYALEMRRPANPLHTALAGYGRYLEGRAELGLGRSETAAEAFNALTPDQFDNKMIATLVAINLMHLGYAEPANKLLSALEPQFAADPQYWKLLSQNAYDLRDANLLRYALEKSYQLRPDDPVTMNNYAAMLLSFREKPDEAIELTLRMLSRFPNSAAVRINHACALLQNKRAAEARKLLASIDSTQLKAIDASSYYMAEFEAALDKHDARGAELASKHVDRTLLLAPDKAWFDHALTNLVAPKKIESPAAP